MSIYVSRVCACAIVQVRRSEDSAQDSILFPIIWGLGTKFKNLAVRLDSRDLFVSSHLDGPNADFLFTNESFSC